MLEFRADWPDVISMWHPADCGFCRLQGLRYAFAAPGRMGPWIVFSREIGPMVRQASWMTRPSDSSPRSESSGQLWRANVRDRVGRAGGCHPQRRHARRWNRCPARKGDLAIKGDRIVAVGSLPDSPGARVLDVSGLIVAPGFIDLHTHSDEGIVKPALRLNLNYLTQGVTTVVTGNCGSGPIDVAQYLGSDRRSRRRHQRHSPGSPGIAPQRRDGRGRSLPDGSGAGAHEDAAGPGHDGRGLGDGHGPDLRAQPLCVDTAN